MEKIFVINLRDAYGKPRNKRAVRAIKIIKEFALRHMKGEDAKISIRLNGFIWAHSIKKPPRKVKVKMLKDNNTVYIFHIDEEAKIPKKKKKEEKEEKINEEKKSNKEVEENSKKEKKKHKKRIIKDDKKK